MNCPAVLLINPKTPYNVGSAIRACSIFGVQTLRWTGKRISTAEGRRFAGTSSKKNRPRLPREERLKDYTNVDWREAPDQVIADFAELGFVPVAIEIMKSSVPLHVFEHPARALYVFGPEDGSLGRPTLSLCHHFVRIASATRTPLNLAAAVNIVLHDRYVKGVPWTSDTPSRSMRHTTLLS